MHFSAQGKSPCHTIICYLGNVQVHKDKVIITFTKFKHYQGHPVTIVLNRHKSSPCQVQIANTYINLRGALQTPFFCHPDGFPVIYNQYNKLFSQVNSFMPNDNTYHLHGFRISAATFAALRGIPEESIKKMRRWHSNAFIKYIRIRSFDV